jgi:nitroreductase
MWMTQYVAAEYKKYNPVFPVESPAKRADDFYQLMSKRRSVREFSDRPVDLQIIRSLIATAGTSPSGANKQPWRFVAVSDPVIKNEIRVAAEAEEYEFYSKRASPEYVKDLGPLGTSHEKPFFDIVPWVVVVFKLVKDSRAVEDERYSDQVYYLNESVGIATGLLLAAAHNAGLSTLTHTPNPMRFLTKILNRPSYERPYMVIPIGYPSDDCMVPDIDRKSIDEIMVVDRETGVRDGDR